ncbi:MAG TPA: DinB family protein [Acidobacteriota bacterium]|nr:DinB family protein [Acidobacteriota bacterium]HNG92746.1 DinB family protein [Acidobacteriota bacterium]HNJ39869.1 DinB family protein [Acidobacteriota bacterium]
MSDPLVETWEINCRINLYLLKAIPTDALALIPPSRGRSVGQAFAHLHNVRLMWLKSAMPELLEGLQKIESDTAHDPELLCTSLTESSARMTELISTSLASGGRVKGFKPHVQAFVGYLISHESHHRGQIMVALKDGGVKIDKKIPFGLWAWGVR